MSNVRSDDFYFFSTRRRLMRHAAREPRAATHRSRDHVVRSGRSWAFRISTSHARSAATIAWWHPCRRCWLPICATPHNLARTSRAPDTVYDHGAGVVQPGTLGASLCVYCSATYTITVYFKVTDSLQLSVESLPYTLQQYGRRGARLDPHWTGSLGAYTSKD